MNLTRLLIRRPLLTTMMFVSICLLGLVAVLRVQVRELPKVDFPAVVVQTTDSGADPKAVHEQITKPIEQALGEVNGISGLTGTSSPGVSLVVAQLDSGSDVNAIAGDISQAVGRIQRQLPDAAQTPLVTKVNPYASPLLTVNFTGTSQQQLENLITGTVQPQLQLISGVGRVNINGGRPTQVSVVVNPQLLAARKITVSDVTQAITTQNVSIAAGDVQSGDMNTTVTTNGTTERSADVAKIVVSGPGDPQVRLGEVAKVTEGPGPPTSTSTLDGKVTIATPIFQRDGSNAIQTAAQVRSALKKMGATFPPDVHWAITSDSTTYTKAALGATAEDLALAIILASLVILMFLQNWRQTLIVLVAIPCSLLATGLMMYLLHFSLDLISLLALSLLIGVLVDDAIVVIDNITRHLGMGKKPDAAALDGRMEIGAAAVALTLTDVVVFLPVAFASGITGQILGEFAITIVVATLFSLLVSFTMTPMLAAHWLRRREHGSAIPRRRRVAGFFEAGVRRMTDGYERLLRAGLSARPLVLVMGLLCLALSAALVWTGRLGTAYVPEQDAGVISVNVQMSPGTSLSGTADALGKLAESVRREVPGVTHVYTTAGGTGPRGGASSGTLTVDLVPKNKRSANIDDLQAEITRLTRGVPGMRGIATVPNPFVPPQSGGLPVMIKGPDLDTLNRLAPAAVTALQKLPSLARVQTTASRAAPGWNVTVDDAKAGSFGLTSQQVAQTVNVAIQGTDVTTVRTSTGEDEPINVSISGGAQFTRSELYNLPVGQVTTSSGGASQGGGKGGSQGSQGSQGAQSAQDQKAITLGQVATITPGTTPLTINDFAQQPQVTVQTVARPGVALSKAKADIERTMNAMALPTGYDYVISGEAQQQSATFGPLLLALTLSPLLVYVLLAGLYESLVLPFCVLLALPLASVGAFGLLTLEGETLNLVSLIGLLMLVGLVSKNSILLVDYTETLRKRGVERHDAIIEAGRTRLRPIVMTTLTLVIAMLPLAFIDAQGSEFRAPMALVLIGGMITNTLLTLVFVPVLYTYLDNLRRVIRPRRGRTSAEPTPPPEYAEELVDGNGSAAHLEEPVETLEEPLESRGRSN